MQIIRGNTQHKGIIWEIAVATWAETYKDILEPEQIEYMLQMMYSPDALDEQMNELGHHFFLIKKAESENWQGFVSFEHNYKGTDTTKIHKLYVLPECHGTGMGRILVDKVADQARTKGNTAISLNMNRNNKTLGFYKHIGFEIIAEEDIDIGNGYLMEDYIFEKKV